MTQEFVKQAAFTKKATDLPDVPSPGLTPAQIKEYFQKSSDELLETVNNVVDKLNEPKLWTEDKLADDSVSRRTIQAGAVGASELDPDILSQPTTAFGVQAKFESIDASLADIAVNINNFGASPANGDNINQINAAIDYAIANGYRFVYRPSGQYKISAMPKAIDGTMQFTGAGFFTLSTQNNRVISWMDRYNDLIFGMEYLYRYHALLSNKAAAKIVFSGDSTTELGQFVNHADSFIKQAGVSTVTCVNKGHAGQSTVEWIATYLNEDLLLNPDLYVVRWGINDTSLDFSLTKVKQFETNLRSGLARIRASKTPEQMSILLMTPNVVDFYTKDKKWGQQINSVIRKAARDYQCAFADTYMYLEDAYNNPAWLDAQLIHPNTIGDKWIVDLISDMLVPNTYRTYVTNPPATAGYTRSANDLPDTYPMGVSIYRTIDGGGGWRHFGIVTTIRQTSNVVLQINSGYDGTKDGLVAFRYGSNNSWSNWVDLNGSLVNAKAATIAFSATTTPADISIGISNHRATVANGFPNEGAVTTINNFDKNICKQELVTYDASGTIKVRTWNVVGGSWNAWKAVTMT